jgi:hypothetical protein
MDDAMDDPENEAKSSAPSLIFWVMAFGLGYAILRYHIAGPVSWKDLPFFILNKGLSLSAFILLTMNFAFGPARNLGMKVPEGWLNARMAIGITGFLLVLIHVLMSLMLFSPAVYGKFFDANATLTLNAGLSMFAGVVAACGHGRGPDRARGSGPGARALRRACAGGYGAQPVLFREGRDATEHGFGRRAGPAVLRHLRGGGDVPRRLLRLWQWPVPAGADFSNERECARNFSNAEGSNLTMGGAYLTAETRTSFKGYFSEGEERVAFNRTFLLFDGMGETSNARERAIGGHMAMFLRWQCRMHNPESPHADARAMCPTGGS